MNERRAPIQVFQPPSKSVVLLLILLLCGCTDTVTKAGLEAEATRHAGDSFPDDTYYVGSEGGYDYFVIRRIGGGSARRYRVKGSEGMVTNRFAVTKDETRWRGFGITGLFVTNGVLSNLDGPVQVIVSNAPVATPH